MVRRSQISLCKFICRHHYQRSPTPYSPLSLTSFAGDPTQRVSNPSPRPNILGTPMHYLANPNRSIQHAKFVIFRNSRKLSGESTELDQNKEVDLINLKFAEAREEIDMAMESKETVYFDEEAECARAAVKEVLDRFDSLLAKLPDKEKGALQRSMGMKMEQLRAELQQLND